MGGIQETCLGSRFLSSTLLPLFGLVSHYTLTVIRNPPKNSIGNFLGPSYTHFRAREFCSFTGTVDNPTDFRFAGSQVYREHFCAL